MNGENSYNAHIRLRVVSTQSQTRVVSTQSQTAPAPQKTPKASLTDTNDTWLLTIQPKQGHNTTNLHCLFFSSFW